MTTKTIKFLVSDYQRTKSMQMAIIQSPNQHVSILRKERLVKLCSM